ncbi:MAG: protease [Kordiimonadaceae bacterium]|nr:protease [Kordiimonadaceae bacterium]
MNIRILISIILATFINGHQLASAQNNEHTLFRSPTLSEDYIVFAYAGDLWRVKRDGGNAQRLTTGIGEETEPYFSPDGGMVAFTSDYDGNTDVYVIPTLGGTPKRLTYHPGEDHVTGWATDGKEVAFNSPRNSYANFLRLFTVSATSPQAPTQVDLPSVERASYNETGTHLAYEPLNQWQPNWKRYHGGQQDIIWIANLDDASIEKVPHNDSSDTYPMWIDNKIYYLSDRGSEEGTVSLFSYDLGNKEIVQQLKNDGLDIKSASKGPNGYIVYEQFGTIHIFDVASGQSNKVDINVSADVVSARPGYINVGKNINNAHISPTGKRALFEARGDIFTVPVKNGDPRNITNTPGVMERSPAWSPDGTSIAYFSDQGGEYNLHVIDQLGLEEAKTYTLPATFYYQPTWSPDSKKIAFYDKKIQLWMLDLEQDNAAPHKIDSNIIGLGGDAMAPNWSPDSNWIAYSKHLPNLLLAVQLYSLESDETYQVTDGMSDARYAAFDKDGKFLHFTASTNMGPTIGMGAMSSYNHATDRSVYSIALANDTTSPLAPKSDEEDIKEEESEEADEDNEDNGKEELVVKIDIEGIQNRIIALAFPARDYSDLTVGEAGSVYVLENIPADNGPSKKTVHKFTFEDKKVEQVASGLTNFILSSDGKMALFSRNPTDWTISEVAKIGKSENPNDGKLATSKLEVLKDPAAEWAQMYHAVWRGERDFFYDENGHGIDFKQMEERYQPYLSSVKHRSDLTYLFIEMANEMTIGHMFIRGGDQANSKSIAVGLLGADYEVENNHYKISKIYNGESWNPKLSGPLSVPGLNVSVGDYILSVNGRDVSANSSIYKYFENTAGKQTRVKISSSASGEDVREIIIMPQANEQPLRHIDWVEGNRRKVDELSGGKLAYIYMPNTAGPGVTSFNRYFFSQTDKQGALLDERFNGGGSLADYVVQIFSRERLANIFFRDGNMDMPFPAGAIYGPKAMLINERAGSGGDAMPWFFKKSNLGPLIGKHTWGGLVAAQSMPTLMDGGRVTAPDAAVYGLDGEWEVENKGIAPDIEVDFDPKSWREGRDPQLEKAVSHLMEELENNPPKTYKRPDFPVYKRN